MSTDRIPAVLVAIPCVDWMWTAPVMALLRLRLPHGSQVMHSEGGATLVRKRNALAQAFIEDERFGALLFLDSDMVPPPATVERLLAHDLPIVGALCFTRVSPYAVCAGHELPGGRLRTLTDLGGRDPVQRVDWHGTGCLLIRREALLKVPRPWFEWGPTLGTGEDQYFSRRAVKAGISVHCDTSLCVGHIGITSVDLAHVAAWQETAEGRAEITAAIGAGADR
jgi:hypothetical protein